MSDSHEQTRRRVHRLAHLLDGQFQVPGTRFRFGWDSVIGLIPGADLVTAVPALYSLFEARRLKMPKGILARMVGNLLIDMLVGLIPVIGDLFDVVFKSNIRNARLFDEGLRRLSQREAIEV